MIEFSFHGNMVPVFTPFNDDATKSINYDVIPEYANHLLRQDFLGILVNGTTGEGTSLSLNERKQLAETWVKVCRKNKQTVMLQIGGAALPDVLDLAKHAERINADAILCLPELYFKPKNTDDLIRYLKLVSDAAPNTPLFYYHIPMMTNVELYMPDLLNEASKYIKTFKGIKFTSNNLAEGIECVKISYCKQYIVFLGSDQLLAPAYISGFNSAIGISFNIFPAMGMLIYNCTKSTITDTKVASNTQNVLTSRISSITKHGYWLAAMKAAMNIFSPINVGPVREPNVELTYDQKEEIKNSAFSS